MQPEHVKATIRRGAQTCLHPTIDRTAKAEGLVLGFETCRGTGGMTNLRWLLVGVGQF
jgi:hypothetical protein